jgi:tetratricopeptide (TPR) repeat protein
MSWRATWTGWGATAAEQLGDLDTVAQVHIHLSLLRMERGVSPDDPSARQSLERLAALSTSLQDPSLAALPLALATMHKVFMGPIPEGVEALEMAIPLMEQRRDYLAASFARGWLAIGYANMGEFDKADEASRRALELAPSNDLFARLDAEIAEAMVRAARGDLDEAAPLARACLKRSEETGASGCAMIGAWVLGDIYQRQGKARKAAPMLRMAVDMSRGLGDAVWGPTLQAWLRANAATLGHHDSAEDGWEEALATTHGMGNHVGEASVLWKRAQVAMRRKRWDAALADLEAAAAIFEAQGARPSLARTLRDWGEALRASGRPAEADQRSRQALAHLEAMGLEREAGQVRESLSS